jgi:hypothetical protein
MKLTNQLLTGDYLSMALKVREIIFDGDVARVPLTRGYYATIDAQDAALVGDVNWQAVVGRHTVYAARSIAVDGGRHTEIMHRRIMGAPCGVPVDHRDGDGLNNRRANLRLATAVQNAHNRTKQANNTSGYKGVRRIGKRWRADIMSNGITNALGVFDTPEQAYAAYCEAATHLHGDFARIDDGPGETEARATGESSRVYERICRKNDPRSFGRSSEKDRGVQKQDRRDSAQGTPPKMSDRTPNTNRVDVRITRRAQRLLEDAAVMAGVSGSKLVERLIEEHLKTR